jgi:hypothetical protein
MRTDTLDRAADKDEPLFECPACGLPAEVTDRFTLGGTPGPVEHVKLVCLAGHWCTPPADRLLDTKPHAAKRTGGRSPGRGGG